MMHDNGGYEQKRSQYVHNVYKHEIIFKARNLLHSCYLPLFSLNDIFNWELYAKDKL